MQGQTPGGAAGRAVRPLSVGALVARLALVGVIVGVLAGAFLYVGGWFSPGVLTPGRMIDRFEAVNGPHPGFRRNHAKGVCFSGTFESNGQGVALSKAAVFAPGTTPVVGRFALAGGQPFVADNGHTVRSMALLFKLSTGEEWRTGMNNIPVFPVNTPEAFYEQLAASAPDPATGKPDPERMAAFLAAHPATAKAMPLIRGRAVSSGFADATYNSLNAFVFTNADGVSAPVRWSMEPERAFAPVSDSAADNEPNALFDALIAAVHAGPVRWELVVTVGEPGDPTRDATAPWPEGRRRVVVGTLTIDRVESEDTSPVRDINFDPLILPDGIASSGDPLLSARSAAYSASFTRREGEAKTSSAVSPGEVRGGEVGP